MYFRNERLMKFMKTFRKTKFLPVLLILLIIAILAVPMMSSAAQATVNLGTTSTYAVLAGETITNTGTTVIGGSAGGDVGLYPGSAFTGQGTATISGTVHISDAAAIIAKTDLVNAYNDAAGRTPVTIIPVELGGQTLTPGVYASENGYFQITGTLTLDAQGDPEGVFIFLTNTTLIAASASTVNNINSARYCRIFWKVGSSATLGTNSHFVGHIFALTSISAQTGANVQGQLLARNGSVTLDNNIINNGVCETATATPTATATQTSTTTPLPNTSGVNGTPLSMLLGFGLMVAAAGATLVFLPKIRRMQK